MTALLLSAFVLGIAGSFHCIGMCGPIALSLPVGDMKSRFMSTFLYNVGRALTYAILGIGVGLVGSFFRLFGFQQWISIIAGVLLLIGLLSGKFIRFGGSGWVGSQMARIRKSIGNLFSKAGYGSVFSIGLLNGLLPCGLVYMALAGAVSASNVAESSLFMLVFGLGTIPAMWTLAFLGTRISLEFRSRIRKAYPYMVAIMACLLIIRGLGLGIPYLSPEMHTGQDALECHD